MPGLTGQTTAAEVNNRLGQIARDFHLTMDRVAAALEFLDAHSNATLLSTYQVTGPDAQALRDAYEDMRVLLRVYRGEQTVPVAADLRGRVRIIAGLAVP